MRARHLVILVLIAFVGAIALSVTGQEEPLPPITPRGVTIVLPIEPAVEYHAPTLAEAAHANDYVTFDALYTEAWKRGQSVALYETLHELWTWSMNDPIGAFYGPDLHARLARAYPGYREFIEEHRIVDSNGNLFYPTSETRAFLLARAIEGYGARVMVAEAQPAQERAAQPRATERRTSTTRSAASVPSSAGSRKPVGSAAERSARQSAGTPKAVAPAALAPSPSPAPGAPAPVAAVTPDPIITEPPVVITPSTAPAPAPVTIAETAPPQPVGPPPVEPPAKKTNLAGRGLLLVIVGLIGVGLLAVILRTPPEDTVTPRRAP